MTYHRFEDLPVWQEAMRLAHGVYDLTENPKFRISFSLRDQIERSSMSVADNIAEGFERGTTNELLAFLYIARGSAGETRSKLCFMEKRRRLAEFGTELGKLKVLAESCSRQIRAWAENLQNSSITGTRHLNNRVRRLEEDRKKAEEARKTILRMLPKDNPTRRGAEERGII